MKLYFVHGYVNRFPIGGWFNAKTAVEAMEMACNEFKGIYGMTVYEEKGKDLVKVCGSGLF